MASKWLVEGSPGKYKLRKINFQDVESGKVSRDEWASGASKSSAEANKNALNKRTIEEPKIGSPEFPEQTRPSEEFSAPVSTAPDYVGQPVGGPLDKKSTAPDYIGIPDQEEITEPGDEGGQGDEGDQGGGGQLPTNIPTSTEDLAALEAARLEAERIAAEEAERLRQLEIDRIRAETLANLAKQPELQAYADGGQWYAVQNLPGVLGLSYFHEYNLPGGRTISYYATKQELGTLIGIGPNRVPDVVATVDYNTYRSDKSRIFGGSIADVAGTSGSYQTRIASTLLAPTGELSLPKWANDDEEIKSLFYVGVAEEWTSSKFLKEIAETDAFQKRFPAFDEMLSVTSNNYADALENYKAYESQIKQLNVRYGEDVDAKTLTEQAIKKGYTIEDIKTTYDIFERAEQNADSLLAFQEIVKTEGLEFDITSPQGIVDFFSGTAPTKIYDLYEASSIAEQVKSFGLDAEIDYAEALKIAKDTPGQLTQQQISTGLQSASQTIARYREYIDLEHYGITADDIINLSLGYKDPSGKTEIELATAISRIINVDENFQNLASGIAGSKVFQKKQRQIRSV